MSYSDLHRDLLQEIFQRVFSGPSKLAGLSIKQVVRQWFALRTICKHWALALEDTPLCVDVEAASPTSWAWLASRRVVLLRVGRFGVLRERRSKSAPQLLPPEQPGVVRVQELGSPELLSSLLLTPSSSSSNSLSGCVRVSSFSALQVLHLKGALSPAGEPCSFSTAPLSHLPSLRHLRLERFTHYDLVGLPPTLRTLRLRYQEAPTFSAQPHPALDVVRLPPATRLALLELDSRASLGMLACQLLVQCEAVAVRATRVYLGVQGPWGGAELLRGFHGGATGTDPQRKEALMREAAERFVAMLAGGAPVTGAGAGGGEGGGALPEAEAEGAPVTGPLLRLLELHWMCAGAVVFVPLPATPQADGDEQQAHRPWPVQGRAPATAAAEAAAAEATAQVAALESAQAAVHEGEWPLVEIQAQQIIELAVQQESGSCAVHAECTAGQQQAMLLRLECRPVAGSRGGLRGARRGF